MFFAFRFCLVTPRTKRLRNCKFGHPILLIAFLLVAVGGCGKREPATGSVEGHVTFESKPVAEGHVVFENRAQGWLHAALLDSEGRYYLPEIRVGDFTVSIQPLEPPRPNEATSSPAELRAHKTKVHSSDPKNVPRPYRSIETSPLKRTVVSGRNQFDFELAEKSK